MALLLRQSTGALSWAVMSDTASKEIAGFEGGVFKMCSNLSSIVIGYIIVAPNALLTALSYLIIVGEI